MKKIFLVLLFVFAVYFSVKKIYFSEKPILRIGSECDYIPNSWEENQPSKTNLPISNHEGFYAEGYDIQMAKLIAREMGMEPQIVKVKWEDIIDALRRREIDVIFSSMLDTEERKKLIDFSDTYEIKKTEYSVMVKKDSKYSDIKKLEELYQARILSQKGSYFEDAIEQIPGAVKVEPVATVQAMFDRLGDDDIDGVIIDVDTGVLYERSNNNFKLIRFPEGEGFIVGFTGVCVGIRKNNKDLLDKVNKAIENIPLKQRQRVMDRVISRLWRNL